MPKKLDLTNADRVGKQYLIDSLMTEKGFTRRDATKATEGLLDAITGALIAGTNVSLSNVGTLRRETAPARTFRNPQTNTPLDVPEREVVRWTMSPTLEDVLNGRSDRESLSRKAPKGTA